MTDVIMPQMGESIAEGTITKWMKNVGDKVQRDEPLFEISTDKVDAEIPAPASGTLKEIRVQPGATVPINTVVGVIAAEGEAVAPAPARAAVTPPAPAPAPPPPAPAAAAPGAPPAAVAPAPPPAPAPPAPPAAPRPWTPAPPSPSAPSASPSLPVSAPSASSPSAVPAPSRADMTVDELRQTRSSPVVRKIAAEHNLDIREIPGTGIAGRVTKQDILSHIEGKPAEAPPPAAPRPVPTPPPAARTPPRPPAAPPSAVAPAPPISAPTASPVPQTPAPSASRVPQPSAPSASSRVEVVPMSPIRKKTAEHMVLSKRTSAHVTTLFEIDMTRVDHLRNKYGPQYQERSGVKLTYLPFILKATVDALKAFPVLNASVEGDAIVYRHDINVGIAVALDGGLIVPVIRNADEKNVLGLARAVNDLAERARSKRLKVEEVQGGTFTITNPGVFGSLFGTPIINQPQVAILGIGAIEKRTVVRDDAIAIRTMAYFALSFDHRIVDGADADRFMAHIKKGLQEFDESAL
jgi:pyruvate dehydrogenase E2 component (dihydrolipoamide acetyltransferase)